MTTLTAAPLAPLLDRLFADADAAEPLTDAAVADLLDEEHADLPDTIDLVLLDGAKALYSEILTLLESRLRPGALIVADNADMSPDYLKRVRSPDSGYMSVPFAEDVELSMRLG
jgi:predicted O-methyltransferase YrrM